MHRRGLKVLLAAYRGRWPQESATVARFDAFVDAHPDCFDRSCRVGHVTGSAWIVDMTGDRVLLAHHRTLGRWLQPGGHSDGDPDTLAVALRETREESGLDVRALDEAIFDIDVHRTPARGNRGDGEPVSVKTERTVRIQIASDLHLEAWRGGIPDEEAFTPVEGRDLLVLAGDIGVALGALTFIRRELARSPVLYVAGNHEHYGPTAHEEVEGAWEWIASETADLHFLNGTPVTIDGVRFYGCTWYSGLWGDADPTPRAVIGHCITDFQAPHNDAGTWTVRRHVETHRRETQAMREHARHVDVMVTHWPPTLDALHPMYANAGETEALVNRYFVNDEEALVREMGARYWISGHTHMPHEATVGKTVTIGNPTGYRNEERGAGFRPDLVIEVEGEPEASP